MPLEFYRDRLPQEFTQEQYDEAYERVRQYNRTIGTALRLRRQEEEAEKKGELAGLTMAFIGDGNNVAHSLLLAASLTGMNFRIASPAGYEVQAQILRLARDYAADSDAEILCTDDPQLAVGGADVVYTDVWASMGQESEAAQRRQVFAGYQVNGALLSLANEDAIFMHDLPAHRGEEVTDEVLDSPQSAVFDQAENRMHIVKALLAEMLAGPEIMLRDYR